MADDPTRTNLLFGMVIKAERQRVKTATGKTAKDFKYARAEKVRPSSVPTYAFVTFQGKEYGPHFVSKGSLEECEEETSTVLIKTEEGIYWKVWFFDHELR